jgi:hypothetical protein
MEIMETSLKMKPGDTNWRINESHFRPAEECRYKPGAVNFALAWFQQGMLVSKLYCPLIHLIGNSGAARY